MKNILFLAVALVGTLSHASHTVCSAPNLYYSSVRGDFGTPPPKGTVTGTLKIFANGKLLVDEKYISGHGQFSIPQYAVTFEGPQEVLETTGVPVAGKKIYKDTAVLHTVAPLPVEEILRTPVVCEMSWAFVP